MSDTIKLGPVEIAAREYAIQGNAVLGIKDSGKSYASMYLAERLMDAGFPIVAFDPIGVWRFLRVGGKGPGYPVVVAGGEHGDLPLRPETAPEIVRAAMREGVSLVLDLYSMELSKADWKRIVQSSVRVLLYENKSFGLRHIFIEEAAEFAPQTVGRGDADGKVYAEIEKLARMGGNAMLGYTLINQRAEEVNKAVLELCDSLYLFRQKGKNSLLSLAKWLDAAGAVGAKEIVPSLPTLPQGDCWAWVSGSDRPVRVHIPEKRTFHPDRRQVHDASGMASREPVNVSDFVERMSALLAPPEPEPETARDVEYIVDDEENHRLRETIAGLEEQLAEARREAQDARDRLAAIASIIGQERVPAAPERPEREPFAAPEPIASRDTLAPAPERAAPPRPQVSTPPVPAGRPKANGSASAEKIPPTTRKILDAIHAAYPVALTFAAAAARAGASRRSSQYGHYERQVRASSEVQEANGRFRSAAGFRRPVKQMGDPIETWASRLPPSYAAMLRQVARASRPLAKEDIAARAGVSPTSSGLTGGLRELVDLALIERIDGDRYQLADGLRG